MSLKDHYLFTLCCGPLPTNLQRLSACLTSVLGCLECPICLDTVSPPVHQCDNGHLICTRCRTRTERCPVCRQRLSRGRSLLAEQVYNALVQAFGLQDTIQENKTSKLRQIFKLKSKKVPDIKVSQSYTDKLVTKLAGKSSSDDNLSSITNPRKSSKCEFGSDNLKTKSLSTNEIFLTGNNNTGLLRTRSVNRLIETGDNNPKKYLDVPNKAVSCHGSFESLENFTCAEDSSLFRCPFERNCSIKTSKQDLLKHFEMEHDGPFVQYFKLPVKIKFTNLLDYLENTSYGINLKGEMFFLKLYQSPNQEFLLLWMWHLGNGKDSYTYRCNVCGFNANDDGATFISIENPVYSLNDVQWEEIINSNKGLCINIQMLDAIKKYTDSELYLEITIVTK